mmetsp:Transcript_4252/g.14989  ORF Transcript_4252/g.14989 Transcript_4252/m.14989 type:complete len:332 (-) Transcript_4252:22-1017(-)
MGRRRDRGARTSAPPPRRARAVQRPGNGPRCRRRSALCGHGRLWHRGRRPGFRPAKRDVVWRRAAYRVRRAAAPPRGGVCRAGAAVVARSRGRGRRVLAVESAQRRYGTAGPAEALRGGAGPEGGARVERGAAFKTARGPRRRKRAFTDRRKRRAADARRRGFRRREHARAHARNARLRPGREKLARGHGCARRRVPRQRRRTSSAPRFWLRFRFSEQLRPAACGVGRRAEAISRCGLVPQTGRKSAATRNRKRRRPPRQFCHALRPRHPRRGPARRARKSAGGRFWLWDDPFPGVRLRPRGDRPAHSAATRDHVIPGLSSGMCVRLECGA